MLVDADLFAAAESARIVRDVLRPAPFAERRGAGPDRVGRRHRARRHRAPARPPGIAAERSAKPRHAAGDPRLDVPDDRRGYLPRLSRTGHVAPARPTLG